MCVYIDKHTKVKKRANFETLLTEDAIQPFLKTETLPSFGTSMVSF